MWSEGDEAHGVSAMSEVTDFSVASGARLLGRDNIMEKEIVAPEEAIAGSLCKRYMGRPQGEKHNGF
jgi:saccharopine dehydrogenase-like NADP-dependent oxidoreductase